MSKELIYALSSMGQVSFSRYKELFKTLYRPESAEDEADVNHRSLISRILDSLGYFEIDLDPRKVFMCPPALVMLPSLGLPRFLLTGARTPALLARVKAAIAAKRNMVRMSRQCQTRKWLGLPDVISIEAADIDSVRDVANRSGTVLSSETPAGWEMSIGSVSTDDIEARLVFVPRQDINWKKRVFDIEGLRFRFPKNNERQENLLVEYTDPLTQQKMHWLWNGVEASEISRDWGRYLTLKNCGKNIAIYDESKQYLGVPLTVPLPRYMSSGKKIIDLGAQHLPGLSAASRELFKSLVMCGLFSDSELHSHQAEMLTKVLEGRNCVVTAGTGSGKTEAFLLPLFAQLSREITGWQAPGEPHAHLYDWWTNDTWKEDCKENRRLRRSYRIPQRSHEIRPPAVRALILYPMNALIEDQLTRLRKALDSDRTRKWYEQNAGGNRIYLGRYNSSTPVPGHERNRPTQSGRERFNKDKIDKLIEKMKEVEAASRAASDYAADPDNPDPDKEQSTFYFPRMGGAEMHNRWDMQDAPPDILITNFSMLGIMMMRESDERIFKKTRSWLACEDLPEAQREEAKQSRIFHLIVDELHLYRGTAGAEVAYLIRLLLRRLGLHPNHSQLRILASSASLEPDDENSMTFLNDFFGANDFEIIKGHQIPVRELEGNNEPLPVAPFTHLAQNSKNLSDDVINEACRLLTGKRTASARLFFESLISRNIELRMLNACKRNDTIRAVSLNDFAVGLFGQESERIKAVQGLLVARSLYDKRGIQHTLPSFRLHYFFRNIEGLWTSIKPRQNAADHCPVGELYHSARIISDEGHRILELLYCEHCGTVFVGGNKLLQGEGELELLATTPDIEAIPERQAARFVERRTHDEYAVFWPMGNQEFGNPARWRQTKVRRNDSNRSSWARWLPASLNTQTGHVVLLHERAEEAPDRWVKGHLFDIQLAADDDAETFRTLPCICPACCSDHTRRRRPSPVRGFRTGFSRVSQILTKELFYQLPASGRKLVVFSDSREDAAQISNGVERNHYSDLVREMVYDELLMEVLGEPRLLTDIENGNEGNYSRDAQEYIRRHPDAAERLRRLIESAAANEQALPAAFRDQVLEARREIEEIRRRGQIRTVPVTRLLPPTDDISDCGTLIRRLLQTGVNPAGNDILMQEHGWDRRWHHWSVLFDFDSLNWRRDLPQVQGVLIARDRIYQSLIRTLCDLFFSRLYFSFESSGLGYPKVPLSEERLRFYAVRAGLDLEVFAQACDSFIRVLGDKYRHDSSEYNQPVFRATTIRSLHH